MPMLKCVAARCVNEVLHDSRAITLDGRQARPLCDKHRRQGIFAVKEIGLKSILSRHQTLSAAQAECLRLYPLLVGVVRSNWASDYAIQSGTKWAIRGGHADDGTVLMAREE